MKVVWPLSPPPPPFVSVLLLFFFFFSEFKQRQLDEEIEFEQQIVPLDHAKRLGPYDRFTVVALLQKPVSHPSRRDGVLVAYAELWDSTASVPLSLWFAHEECFPRGSRLFDVFLARNCVMSKSIVTIRAPAGSFLILNSRSNDHGGWVLSAKEAGIVEQMRALSISSSSLPAHVNFVPSSFMPSFDSSSSQLSPLPLPMFHSLAHIMCKASSAISSEALVVRVAVAWEEFGRVQMLLWDGSGPTLPARLTAGSKEHKVLLEAMEIKTEGWIRVKVPLFLFLFMCFECLHDKKKKGTFIESEFYDCCEIFVHELVWVSSQSDEVKSRLENFVAFGANTARLPEPKWLESCRNASWKCSKCVSIPTLWPKLKCFACQKPFRAENDFC